MLFQGSTIQRISLSSTALHCSCPFVGTRLQSKCTHKEGPLMKMSRRGRWQRRYFKVRRLGTAASAILAAPGFVHNRMPCLCFPIFDRAAQQPLFAVLRQSRRSQQRRKAACWCYQFVDGECCFHEGRRCCLFCLPPRLHDHNCLELRRHLSERPLRAVEHHAELCRVRVCSFRSAGQR